jgi:hypothetical protein
MWRSPARAALSVLCRVAICKGASSAKSFCARTPADKYAGFPTAYGVLKAMKPHAAPSLRLETIFHDTSGTWSPGETSTTLCSHHSASHREPIQYFRGLECGTRRLWGSESLGMCHWWAMPLASPDRSSIVGTIPRQASCIVILSCVEDMSLRLRIRTEYMYDIIPEVIVPLPRIRQGV